LGSRGVAVATFADRGLFDVCFLAMSNVCRLCDTDRIFFVTVRLRRQLALFRGPEYQLMLDVFRQSRWRLPFMLCGYVLMPDHWHALIWTGYPLTISRVIHDVKKVSAHRLHRERATKGPVWQRQFWDRFVRNSAEFNERLEYMHLNPVRRGLVAKPEEWRWSSYNNFALDKATVAHCPIEIDYVRLPEGYRA
jgi:putative transposase